jgi:hypothetical protein
MTIARPLTAGDVQQHAANIDMAVATILDLLKIGATFYPPLSIAAPAISMFINFEAHKLKTGLADGSVLPDGQGGFVSKAWSDDPRHALNPDGSFKE